MIVYKPYYDREWHIAEIDAEKARRIGGSLLYGGWIYGPANELFTNREAAAAWIMKDYGQARKYQITLEQAKEAV